MVITKDYTERYAKAYAAACKMPYEQALRVAESEAILFDSFYNGTLFENQEKKRVSWLTIPKLIEMYFRAAVLGVSISDDFKEAWIESRNTKAGGKTYRLYVETAGVLKGAILKGAVTGIVSIPFIVRENDKYKIGLNSRYQRTLVEYEPANNAQAQGLFAFVVIGTPQGDIPFIWTIEQMREIQKKANPKQTKYTEGFKGEPDESFWKTKAVLHALKYLKVAGSDIDSDNDTEQELPTTTAAPQNVPETPAQTTTATTPENSTAQAKTAAQAAQMDDEDDDIF